MKSIKLSLVASLTIAGFSTISSAQALEEAIKGVDASGYLRYRFNESRFQDQNFKKDSSTKAKKGSTSHQYRGEITFLTPPVNSVALNLGVRYDNSNNVGAGKGITSNPPKPSDSFLGNGLGAGKDGPIGVSQFNAIITPEFSNTKIKAGKMYLQTPLDDTTEDRGTGIYAINSDIPNWNFILAAYNSWNQDEFSDNGSVDKPLYLVAALANYDTAIGNLQGQAWLYKISQIVKTGFFGELGWNNGLFHLKGQYALARLNGSPNSPLVALYSSVYSNGTNNAAGFDQNFQFNKPKAPNSPSDRIKESADLYTLEAGVKFHNFDAFSFPLALKIGYWGNTQGSYAVSIDDEGAFQTAAKRWRSNPAIGISASFLPLGWENMPKADESNKLSVIYAGAKYDLLDNLGLALEYAKGSNTLERRKPAVNPSKKNYIKRVASFQEITPIITYKYNKNIDMYTYYALLKTDINVKETNELSSSEHFNYWRVQVRYSF